MTIKTPCAHDGCGKNVDPRTKSGLCITHKVEALRMSRLHLERPCADGCGVILTHRNKRDICGACISKRAKARIKPCTDCGKLLTRDNRTGFCRACLTAQTEQAKPQGVVEFVKPAPPFSITAVLQAASLVTGVDADDLASGRRWGKWVRIRAAIYYVARPYFSLPQIGQVMGGRDHTTVLHGYRFAEQEVGRDWKFLALCDSIRNEATRKTLRKRRLIAATVERLAA